MGGQVHGEANLRPHPGSIILISGEIGSGKTWLLTQILEMVRISPMKVRGLLSPPIEGPEGKTGIDLVNLETGETRRSAELRQSTGQGLFTQKWQFDASVMGWGNEILRDACPCDLLVIDELGPLEFERAEGWQNGLKQLDSREFKAALVVVRPSLLPIATSRWPDAKVKQVTRQNQTDILAELFTFLLPNSDQTSI